MADYLLSIDQGTTGTTAIIFDEKSEAKARVNYEHKQYYPRPGWVEHDAEEIYQNVLAAVKDVLHRAGLEAAQLAAIGIANQRETLVFWDRVSGKPLHRAIVWQCRRTSDLCRHLKEEGFEEMVRAKTGLLLDPYFTGTKIRWAMENIEAVKEAAQSGRLALGTIDSYLLFRLTGGRVHATDYSNASRTLLFNIHALKWDEELLDLFKAPAAALPEVLPSSGIFGHTDADSFFQARVPIGGIAGDQQAALFGQACFSEGMIKNTYGTGCFLLMNTGSKAVSSRQGLLTTLAWGLDGAVDYALEGSIFITGAALQWLRDGLGIINSSAETESLALQVEDNGGVYFVPAFAGLGAPHWDPYARGALVGITGGTKAAHLARAAVEAMAYQTRDVLEVMRSDSALPIKELRVDGGASVMDLLLQFQADLSSTVVRRAATSDTTALGAAYLAGLAVKIWNDKDELSKSWRESAMFSPVMMEKERERLYGRWQEALKRSLAWAEKEA